MLHQLTIGLFVGVITLHHHANALTCPSSWNSIHSGRCVKVFSVKKTYTEAVALCQIFESELLSAGHNLHQLADDISTAAVDVSQVLVGLTDPWDTRWFQWIDGSLMDNSIWADDNPAESGGRCAVFRTAERNVRNVHCTDQNAFICQKIRGFSGCYESWDFVSVLSTVPSVDSDMITLQVCVQVCRGKDDNMAAIWKASCYCFSNFNMGTLVRVGSDKCNQPCPGNTAQMCGDVQGQYLTVLDIGQYTDSASSCMGLYSQGIRVPGPYKLSTGDPQSSQSCYYTDLESKISPRLTYAPTDWIFWNGNFYWFHTTGGGTFDEFNALCFNQGGGYLTSVLSKEELHFIEITIKGSPSLSSIKEWLVGLTDVTTSGYPRWAGPVLFDNYPSFRQTCTASKPCCVLVTTEEGVLQDCSQDDNTIFGFICKQSHDFRGCRQHNPTTLPISHHWAYGSGMSALLCKELCRGEGTDLAQVMEDDCYCQSSIPTTADLIESHWCNASCPGHFDQFCGGDTALWYSLDTEELGTSCDQLMYNGIDKPASYLLSADLQSTSYSLCYCDFESETKAATTLVPDSTISVTPTQVPNPHILVTPTTIPDSQIPVIETSVPDSHILETPTPDPNSQILVTPTPDSNSQILVTPTPDPSSQILVTPIPDPSSQILVTPTPDPNSRILVKPTPDPNSQILVTSTPDPNFQILVMPTPDPNSQILVTPTLDPNSQILVIESSRGLFPYKTDQYDWIHYPSLFSEVNPSRTFSSEYLTSSIESLHGTDGYMWISTEPTRADTFAKSSIETSVPSSTGLLPSMNSDHAAPSPLGHNTKADTAERSINSHVIRESTLSLPFITDSSQLSRELLSSHFISGPSFDLVGTVSYSKSYGSFLYSCTTKVDGEEVTLCPCLFLITNAETSTCETAENTSVILSCRSGWIFPSGQENMTTVCGTDGNWIPRPYHCVPEQHPNF